MEDNRLTLDELGVISKALRDRIYNIREKIVSDEIGDVLKELYYRDLEDTIQARDKVVVLIQIEKWKRREHKEVHNG